MEVLGQERDSLGHAVPLTADIADEVAGVALRARRFRQARQDGSDDLGGQPCFEQSPDLPDTRNEWFAVGAVTVVFPSRVDPCSS